MAAEQSTRASASGSNSHSPEALSASGSVQCADLLSEVLGKFCSAISVLGVTCLALEKASEEPQSAVHVGMFAVAAGQAHELLNSAYEQLDLALLELRVDDGESGNKRRAGRSTPNRAARVRGRKPGTKPLK